MYIILYIYIYMYCLFLPYLQKCAKRCRNTFYSKTPMRWIQRQAHGIQDPRCRIQDPGSSWILDWPGSWTEDPGSWTRDPGSWSQDPGSWGEYLGSWILEPGSRILEAGSTTISH